MENAEEDRDWAAEEFGLAELGDKRRVKRLVKVATVAAKQPAGQVTAVFTEPAAREGSYRLLENEAVAPEAIASASHRACVRRVGGAEFAFVPVDGTSLNLADEKRNKGTGVVGARAIGARGLQVMTAICVSREGVPLGLCGQKYWAREERTTRKGKHDRRPVEEKETHYWLEVKQQARKVFASDAPQTKPWFQLDRGADAWPVLLDGLQSDELFTVRAAYNRRLAGHEWEPQRRYLWDEVEAQPLLGTMELQVKAKAATKKRPAQPARTAVIEMRAAKVSLDLCLDSRRKRQSTPPLFALLACETSASAGTSEPIEWMLLTNRPIKSLADAQLVLFGYSQRWRIEEFHRCWKSGVCKVEHMQLRDASNMQRWAAVLAAVAMRVLRLTYLSRHAPGLAATEELTTHEIDALILGSKSREYRHGTIPPIGAVTLMAAKLGGYIGKSSGGPPGPLVISRGLLKIEALADVLEDGSVRPT